MTELILAEPTTLAPAEQMAIIGQIANQHAAGSPLPTIPAARRPAPSRPKALTWLSLPNTWQPPASMPMLSSYRPAHPLGKG